MKITGGKNYPVYSIQDWYKILGNVGYCLAASYFVMLYINRYRIYDDDVLSSSSEAEMRKNILQKSALPPKINGAMSPSESVPSSPSR